MFTLYQTSIPADIQIWLALAFLLAFAVKVPMFPFHTWLPDAIVLAVVIVKMAAYGFLRFSLPIFPETLPVLAPWLCGFAVVGIIYGALVAWAQDDIKKLIAYSTVSHSGFVVLGVFALNHQGIQGAILQIVSLGLSTGGLFLVVMMLQERCRTWSLDSYGGLWHTIPVLGAFLMVFTMASVGLPGLSNFVGEFLILIGAFQANKIYAIIAAVGVILAAVYMLRMYKRIMFGPMNNQAHAGIADLSFREIIVCAGLTVMIVWIGVYPKPFLETMDASVQKLVTQTQQVSVVPSTEMLSKNE
jgi:NADH-quinone oxidoreductase subunit M